MRRKAATRFHRSGQIVVLFALLWGGMLQYAWDETDLVRRLHGDEGCCCAAEVVQTHGLPELGVGAGADNVVNTPRGERTALKRRPKAVMIVGADQLGTDLLQIALEIGEKQIGDPEALGPLGLGVFRKEQDSEAVSIKLQVPADGEGGDAAAADQPQAEQCHEEPITILQLPLLARRWQGERFVHQLDPEIQGAPAGNQLV